MGSGSRRILAEWCVFFPLLFAACAPAPFVSRLAVLDELIASAPGAEQVAPRLEPAFDAAMRSAGSSSEWLSLIKRSLLLGPAYLQRVAEKARGSMPGSEPIALALAYSNLRIGRPEVVLALFTPPAGSEARVKENRVLLAPDEYPALWAEALLRLRARGAPLGQDEDPESMARLAGLLGLGEFYTEAALASFRRGDRFSAAAFLRLALERGAEPRDELLWDAGLVTDLAARWTEGAPRRDATVPGLLRAGDAAMLAGDIPEARRLWKAGLDREPQASWRARAKLALYAPDEELGLGEARVLARDFPDSPGALRFETAFLLRGRRDAEAQSLLEKSGDPLKSGDGAEGKAEFGLLALAAQGRTLGEGHLLAETIRLVESEPSSGMARSAALRLLLERGSFGDYLVLFDTAESLGLSYPYRWFYSAVAKVLRGDFAEAAALLEQTGPSAAGPEAAFALGLLYGALGDEPRALDRYAVALDAARSGRERARVLKAIGRSQGKLGRPELALAAFRAATMADPEDAEAAFLSNSR